MPPHRPRRPGARRGRLGAAVVLVAVTALAACSDESVASAAPTPTRVPEPTARVTTYAPAATVWYAGLVISIDTATAKLDQRGGSVTVAARLANQASPDPISVEGPIALVVGGEAFEPTRETQLPDVEQGQVAAVDIEFDVVGHASAEDAVLVIGRDGEHQARVPVGPAGGETAAFQPIDLELSGSTTAGQLRLRLRRAQLRWDLPDWGQQLPADRAVITVVYDATYVGSFGGGFAFTADNVRLRLPDGTLVAPRQDGRSQSTAVIGPGKTKRDVVSRFEIPSPVTGELQLVAVDGRDRKGIPFTIPG
jgi:hypothetical protein